MTKLTNNKISADAWLDEALQALAGQGWQAVAVEPLAKKLGVTKGSFYWHFKNRGELVTQLLSFWEQIEERYIQEYQARFVDADIFLKEVLTILIQDELNKRVFLALNQNKDNGEISVVYDRAVKRRVSLFESVYVQMGVRKSQAKEKSLQTYCSYLGLIQLLVNPPVDILTTKDEKRLVSCIIEQALVGCES